MQRLGLAAQIGSLDATIQMTSRASVARAEEHTGGLVSVFAGTASSGEAWN